jgi:hypothetical protein
MPALPLVLSGEAEASTNAAMSAEMLSYSGPGVAGVSLEGTSLGLMVARAYDKKK